MGALNTDGGVVPFRIWIGGEARLPFGSCQVFGGLRSFFRKLNSRLYNLTPGPVTTYIVVDMVEVERLETRSRSRPIEAVLVKWLSH